MSSANKLLTKIISSSINPKTIQKLNEIINNKNIALVDPEYLRIFSVVLEFAQKYDKFPTPEELEKYQEGIIYSVKLEKNVTFEELDKTHKEYLETAGLERINTVVSEFRHRVATDIVTQKDIDEFFSKLNKIKSGMTLNSSEGVISSVDVDLEELFDNRHFEVYETGLNVFDLLNTSDYSKAHGGITKADFIGIGAPSGRGKSFLTSWLAARLAKGGKKVLFINCEMKNSEMWRRIFAFYGELPMGFEKDIFNKSKNIATVKSKMEASEGYIYMPKNGVYSPNDIEGFIHEIKEEHGHNVDFVIIDGLALMKDNSGNFGKNDYSAMLRISIELRFMQNNNDGNFGIIYSTQMGNTSMQRIDYLERHHLNYAKQLIEETTAFITLNEAKNHKYITDSDGNTFKMNDAYIIKNRNSPYEDHITLTRFGYNFNGKCEVKAVIDLDKNLLSDNLTPVGI